VVGRAAEKLRVDLSALEPIVEVRFPGEADSAVGLDRRASDRDRALRGNVLGD